MQEWSYPSAEAAIKRPNKLTVSRDRSLDGSYFEQDAATWVVNLSIHGLISKALFHLRIDAVWFMRAQALKKTFPHGLDNWSCGFQRRGAFFVAGGGMWWCKPFCRAPETRSSPNIKREDGRFWPLARTAAVIPRTPLWVCGCPQSACGLCVKKARALICPGLD